VSTLHTIDAGQTINRILGMFEQEEQEQIRLRLSDTIRWIVSQRLAPKIGGGRQALLEIMGSNMRVRDSVVMGEGEGKSFYEIIEASYTFGWRTFDQACLDAYDQGMITEETALLYCSKKGPVTRGIDNIKKRRGETTTDVDSLAMKKEEAKKNAPPIPAVLKLK
jgi:twitching motility protein PilT